MSNSVTLLGTLTAGQQAVCEGGFPSGLLQVKFGLAGSCPGEGTKPAAKKFWSNVDANSPTGFVTLAGIGTGQTVTKANTLYIRTTVSLLLRLTLADPSGGPDIVSTFPVQGLHIAEYPAAGCLKLLEVKGVGGVEYFASGDE